MKIIAVTEKRELMTREEAKRHLEYISVCSENHVTMAVNSRDRQAIEMAIKALEQSEAHGVRLDTISRQAAIDFVGSMEMCDEISGEAYQKLTNYLDELPSATCGNLEKPERPQHSEDKAADCNLDCISRQAAVALAKDIIVPTKDGSTYKHRCIDPDEIRKLPSAQPEAKDCSGCRHGRFGDTVCDRCSRFYVDRWEEEYHE
jgi:hypothetical protein